MKTETIDRLRDSGKAWGNLTKGLFGDRPPQSAYTVTREHPAIYEAPREGIDGGNIAIVGVLFYIAGDKAIRWGRSKVTALREARGDRRDAGN